MPEMINPLAAFRDGYNTVQGFRDDYAKRQAGNALAGGDYRGGANALLQNGMLSAGMDVQQAGQERDQAAQTAAKLRQGEGLKAILDGGQSLLRIPAEQRAAVYQSQIVPLLQSRGVPDELLQQMGQSTFTDQELQTFVTGLGGELSKPQWQILNMGARGAYAVNQEDPTQRQTLFEPQAPESQVVEGPDGLYERQPDGNWKKVSTFGAAPKVFAPRAAGGASGAGSSQTYSDVPPGAVVVR
jgi:hypothetical protein